MKASLWWGDRAQGSGGCTFAADNFPESITCKNARYRTNIEDKRYRLQQNDQHQTLWLEHLSSVVPRTEKDLKSPLSISVGDREARTDCQCGDLIDRIAAGAPLRKLLFVEALGDTRPPTPPTPSRSLSVSFVRALFCERISSGYTNPKTKDAIFARKG